MTGNVINSLSFHRIFLTFAPRETMFANVCRMRSGVSSGISRRFSIRFPDVNIRLMTHSSTHFTPSCHRPHHHRRRSAVRAPAGETSAAGAMAGTRCCRRSNTTVIGRSDSVPGTSLWSSILSPYGPICSSDTLLTFLPTMTTPMT